MLIFQEGCPMCVNYLITEVLAEYSILPLELVQYRPNFYSWFINHTKDFDII